MSEAAAGSACARAATMRRQAYQKQSQKVGVADDEGDILSLAPFEIQQDREVEKADRQSDAAAMTRARCAATAPSKRASSSASGPLRPRFSTANA